MTSRGLMRSSVVLGFVAIACGGSTAAPAQSAAASGGDAGGTKDVFASGPAYVAAPVTTTAAASHTAKKIAAPTKDTACLSCHKTGGTAPSFVLGGTVFTADNGKTPLAGAEIRFVDAKGTLSRAHSDADGNFWLAGPSVTTETGKAAARTATLSKVMDVPASGNCNECHASNMPLYVK